MGWACPSPRQAGAPSSSFEDGCGPSFPEIPAALPLPAGRVRKPSNPCMAPGVQERSPGRGSTQGPRGGAWLQVWFLCSSLTPAGPCLLPLQTWDEELERSAAAWAHECIWEHGPTSLLVSIGQNLAVHWGR